MSYLRRLGLLAELSPQAQGPLSRRTQGLSSLQTPLRLRLATDDWGLGHLEARARASAGPGTARRPVGRLAGPFSGRLAGPFSGHGMLAALHRLWPGTRIASACPRPHQGDFILVCSRGPGSVWGREVKNCGMKNEPVLSVEKAQRICNEPVDASVE